VAFLHDPAVLVDRAGLAVLPLADASLRWRLSTAVSTTRRPSAPLRALLALLEAQVPPLPADASRGHG
jgi:hypothetical protein